MTILLNNDGHWHDQWRRAIERYIPGRSVIEYPDVIDPAVIEYALIWKHPPGDLERYPNLRAVFSLGSGVDYIDAYPTLPDAPIYRLIDINMADDMALYTLYWVIHFQRQLGLYAHQQSQAEWRRYVTPLAPDYKVCVLGQGAIGGHIGQVLSRNGFDVYGWSRNPKSIEGVKLVSGETGLSTTLPEMDVVICCLPMTDKTRGIIDKNLLAQVKSGAAFINVSRGAVVNEPDLLDALDKGQLAGAALDVFVSEPLPADAPFWTHPKVYVTPHMSGATNPDTAVQIIAENMALIEKGGTPQYRYIREG